MKVATLIMAAGLGLVILHDMGAESCNRWYRIPLQLGCDLALQDLPFGNPLYEFAYGASDSQALYGFHLTDPWSYRDPRHARESAWTNLQAGTFTIVEPLNLVLVTPPPWLDPNEFMQSFLDVNPTAVAISESSSPPPFVLVQFGGGVEGLMAQVLLGDSGKVTGWSRRGRWTNDTDGLRIAREGYLQPDQTSRLFELATAQSNQSGARFYWNCRLQDGGASSLTTFDGEELSRSHWVNSRWPSESASEVFEALLDAGIPPDESLY